MTKEVEGSIMDVVKIVNDIFGYLFYIIHIALFYSSLKICFAKERKGSIKLFFA